jgi:adhesin HecA-like repeat protein
VQALTSFALLYINWSYRDLTSRQRTLAAISVGAARTAESQAAASSAGDVTLGAAHLANSGSVVSITGDQAESGLWAIVTHEQTHGSGDYEGLPPAYHVTLARVTRVPGGYAVSEWLPQS